MYHDFTMRPKFGHQQILKIEKENINFCGLYISTDGPIY